MHMLRCLNITMLKYLFHEVVDQFLVDGYMIVFACCLIFDVILESSLLTSLSTLSSC